MKKIVLWVLLCALLLTGCGAPETPETEDREEKLQIVATVFPAYDFARAAAGDLADVRLLLPPGAESHSYEPTPTDILAVQECDLFIYLGGESDAWVDTIVSAIERQGDTMRMVDSVDLLEEMTVEGMQTMPGHHHHHHEGEEHHESECPTDVHHHADECPAGPENHVSCPEEVEHHNVHGLGGVVDMDEHVWTSPRNAAKITRNIGEKLAVLDPENGEQYRANAERYAGELDALDQEFAEFFESLPDKTMVFGDRFPLRYFAAEYDLPYYAAFPGCSTQTEPSAATIAFLTEKVREENISTIFYIEFSNHLVADSIAEATGTHTAMYHTCHNISPDDLAAGETYLSLMRNNLKTLRENLG